MLKHCAGICLLSCQKLKKNKEIVEIGTRRNLVEAGLVTRAIDWPFSSCQYYEGKKADGISDGYPQDVLPSVPKHMDNKDQSLFERGAVIGSNYFKFQLKETMKGTAGDI